MLPVLGLADSTRLTRDSLYLLGQFVAEIQFDVRPRAHVGRFVLYPDQLIASGQIGDRSVSVRLTLSGYSCSIRMIDTLSISRVSRALQQVVVDFAGTQQQSIDN